MTTNEAIAKYNFISKAVLSGDLSKEMKVKVMTMRIELSKIKKSFDEDSKAFADQIVTDDFRNLAMKQDKTDEEKVEYSKQEAEINEAYIAYIQQLGQKEVNVDTTLTVDEYNELMVVNVDNDVEINGQKISAGDYLEILYTLFVKE